LLLNKRIAAWGTRLASERGSSRSKFAVAGSTGPVPLVMYDDEGANEWSIL